MASLDRFAEYGNAGGIRALLTAGVDVDTPCFGGLRARLKIT
jgi:hypothetical protein